MLAIVWGYLVYSLFIVSMNVLTTLTEEESEVYKQLVAREQSDQTKPEAERVIFSFLVFRKKFKKKERFNRVKQSEKYEKYFTPEQKVRLERQIDEL